MRLRYNLFRVAWGIFTVALMVILVNAITSDQPFFWKKAPLAIEFTVICICYAYLTWHFRKLALKEKSALTAAYGGQKTRRQSFLWQGIFILLPVAAMAGFGFWAILRERNAVEQEARQRASDILQALPGEFGRMAASDLMQYETAKNGWFSYLQFGVAAWPADLSRRAYLDDSNEVAAISNAVATMKAAFPDWKEGAPPIVNFLLETNGEPVGLSSTPPRPPDWFSSMPTEQHRAWTALVAAGDAAEASSNIIALAEAFEQTAPSEPAWICADFIRLRAELRSHSATNAVDRLLRFGNPHYALATETGLPLTSLTLAAALKRAQECGPSAQLWSALQSEAIRGSTLAPALLDEAGELVAQDAQLTEGIGAMRILCADKEAQGELAEAVKQTGSLNGIITTNLWVDAMNRRWFCILAPNQLESWTTISNRPVATTNHVTEAWCFPQSLVSLAFAKAFDDARLKLPDYFSLSLELEGEPIALPPPWNHAGEGKPAGEVFAEEHLQMRQPGMQEKVDPVTHQRTQVTFEIMPGHPHFTVQVHLSDRGLLYARQRQLQWIFGALIAVSALAALIGFLAAQRAFRRQLQLGELKTNFVSSVSHELRAPIASVRLMAEGLERGKIAEPEKQREYFRFIVQECRRLSSLIENVLDFSRIEEGRKRYDLEPTDLVALVGQTVKVMDTYAAERQVALALEVNGQPSSVDADGKALQQALVNLIDNAVKHSPKGGGVKVGLEFGASPHPNPLPEERAFTNSASLKIYEPADGVVRLWVEDQGEGIAASEHEKIFERFYRVGSELRRETQGVGIGLSIVKHIVEAHGGRVTVRSAPGRGSRFTIELPAGGNRE